MQTVVYKCDNDGKEIGAKPHITMQAQKSLTGIAIPPGVEYGGWTVKQIPMGFVHFCDPKCLAAYFQKMLDKVTPKKPAKK